MNKNKITIALIFLVAIVMLVFFVNNRSPAPTTNTPSNAPVEQTPENSQIPESWVLYESELYGFSISHPLDVEQQTTQQGEAFIKPGPTQGLGTELFDGISVTIRSGTHTDASFEEFVELMHSELKEDPIQPIVGETREVTLAGIRGIAFDVSSLGDYTITYLPKDTNEYIEITDSTVEPRGREQNFRQIVDMMLSTLELN
jgi:hypothetical protein